MKFSIKGFCDFEVTVTDNMTYILNVDDSSVIVDSFMKDYSYVSTLVTKLYNDIVKARKSGRVFFSLNNFIETSYVHTYRSIDLVNLTKLSLQADALRILGIVSTFKAVEHKKVPDNVIQLISNKLSLEYSKRWDYNINRVVDVLPNAKNNSKEPQSLLSYYDETVWKGKYGSLIVPTTYVDVLKSTKETSDFADKAIKDMSLWFNSIFNIKNSASVAV